MKHSHPPISIDIFGNRSGKTGWSTHSNEFARAMNKINPVNFRGGCSRRDMLSKDFNMVRRGLFYPPGEFGVIINGDGFPEQKNARWIVWETTELPDHVRDMCKSSTFLWTPSSWGYKNLINNGVSPDRVGIVPEGVNTNFFKPGKRNRSKRFRFLFVGKWESRKCVEELINCFTAEFSPNENVELVLHAHNQYIKNFSQKEMIEKLKIPSKFNIILSEPNNLTYLRSLYQSADCFVMPTRAEGWGLPILESMACGTPAIVTNYSAPTDFVTDQSGYLLEVEKMVDAKCDQFNITTGLWAEPNFEHLKYLMREAFQKPDELYAKGRAAYEKAREFSWDNAAHTAYQFIASHL
jgi:glycosyltransferase involved in cell wall biosynthesis